MSLAHHITGTATKGITMQHMKNAVLRDVKVTGLAARGFPSLMLPAPASKTRPPIYHRRCAHEIALRGLRISRPKLS